MRDLINKLNKREKFTQNTDKKFEFTNARKEPFTLVKKRSWKALPFSFSLASSIELYTIGRNDKISSDERNIDINNNKS